MSSSLSPAFLGCVLLPDTAVGPTQAEACRTVLGTGQQGGGSECHLPP